MRTSFLCLQASAAYLQRGRPLLPDTGLEEVCFFYSKKSYLTPRYTLSAPDQYLRAVTDQLVNPISPKIVKQGQPLWIVRAPPSAHLTPLLDEGWSSQKNSLL